MKNNPTIGFYTVKGGAGCSTIVTCLAALWAKRANVTIIDFDHDQLPLHGLSTSSAPRLRDVIDGPYPAERVAACETEGPNRVRIIETGYLGEPRERTRKAVDRWPAFMGWLPGPVVHDVGFVGLDGADARARRLLLTVIERRYLVVRLDYLTLRRAATDTFRPDGIVVVETESPRSLTPHDAESVIGVPMVGVVPFDSRVANGADAGVLASRVPTSMAWPLRRLLPAEIEIGDKQLFDVGDRLQEWEEDHV